MRRNTGNTFVSSNNRNVDNRDCVSYNGTLLKISNCHMNVVAIASFLSVKYLFQYVYKGHDRADVVIHDNAQHNSQNNVNTDIDNILN